MRFSLPFTDGVTVRLFERVETVDDSYRIVDTGFQYDDGSIDSVAVGGNFSSLARWTGNDAESQARRAESSDSTPTPASEPTAEPVAS